MKGWRGLAPSLWRGVGLLAGVLVLRTLGEWSGYPIDWQLAILYGAVLGVAARWPIVLPNSGVRVILPAGLVLDGVWRGGPFTGFALFLVEFGAQMLALESAHRLWEWYRPAIALGALGSAWGLSYLVQAPPGDLWPEIHTDAAALVLAFGFWIILALFRLVSGGRGRNRGVESLLAIRQTWWVPILLLAIGWTMALLHRSPYPLEVPAALLLLWFQRLLGPVFTTLHQDRSVAGLLRLAPWQSPGRRATAQETMRMAHALGRVLHLSGDDLRSVEYAALLQDAFHTGDPPLPIWYPSPPPAGEIPLIREYIDSAVRRIEQDRILLDVANLVWFRYASYDGTGYPPVAGDAIPLGAQVLSAANALVYLTSAEGRCMAPEQAVEWIRTHAESKFHRDLVNAMLSTTGEVLPAKADKEGLPQTIRQLQGLVSGHGTDSALRAGLHRAALQLRGQAPFLPELPEEVQAVARLSTILATSQSLGEAVDLLVRSVGQLMNAKVALALADERCGDLNLHVQATYDYQVLDIVGRQIAVQGGYLGRALVRHEPTQLGDLKEGSAPLAQEIAQMESVRSVLFMPLVRQGRSVGLLTVGLTRHHWFTPREVGLIHLMSDLAAASIERTRLTTQLEDRIRRISELNAFTDTLLDNLSKAILVVDPQCNLVLANAAAHEYFDSLGKQGDPLPPPLRGIFPVEQVLAGESPGELDVAWGSQVLAVTAHALRDEAGLITGVICQARDVTQVRQMEEQAHRLEKMAAVAELAAGAAHEIRNPLTSIRGFMQLLQAQGRSGPAEYFPIILSEIDRIDGIIRDMLLLARPAQLQRTPTTVRAVVDGVLLLHQAELGRRSIQCDQRIEVDGPVLLDAKMFRQLLLNLIINAVHAMPSGGTLNVGARRTQAEYLILTVSDTGEGIAPENLKRLFDPFFTTKEEGTGLGLALCHSIVQAHGGSIEVESKVNVGTTFTVTLYAPAA